MDLAINMEDECIVRMIDPHRDSVGVNFDGAICAQIIVSRGTKCHRGDTVLRDEIANVLRSFVSRRAAIYEQHIFTAARE
jgi:hypothetical protein